MNNITIGRYKPTPGGPFSDLPVPVKDDEGTVVSTTDISTHFDGWIEGVRDDGSTWIMWLDATGSPQVFYPKREPGGGIDSDPIWLGGKPEGWDDPQDLDL